MDPEPDLQQKYALLAGLFKSSNIPHADRLVRKLSNNPHDCFLNAITAWALHKNGTYAVTDLEVRDGTRDVAIQLDHDINMQSCDEVEVFEDQSYESTNKAGTRAGRDRNREIVLGKLGLLPDDGLGILLVWSEFAIPGLQNCIKDMPANKCVMNIDGAAVIHYARQWLPWPTPHNLSTGGVAMIYHARDFKETERLGRIAGMLGCPETTRVVIRPPG